MNDGNTYEQENKLMSFCKKVGGVFLFFFFLVCLTPFLGILVPATFDLFFGWLVYLSEISTKIILVWSDIFFSFFLFFLICIGVNYFSHIFTHPQDNTDNDNGKWSFKSSFILTALIVVLFGSGISTVAMAHQCIWMLTGKDTIISSSVREAARRTQSRNNLRNFALAVNNFENKHHQFPEGITVNDSGELLHSWITQILPDIEEPQLYGQIDLSSPWNAQVNSEHFKTELYFFSNPMLREDHQRIGPDGFALSHYAGNIRVMPVGHSLRLKDIENDGTSHTILMGEVSEGLQPWGSPWNLRDPAAGINVSNRTFGSTWRSNGAHFGLVDGSVHFINQNIDPDILKALSTPNGGEDVDYDF